MVGLDFGNEELKDSTIRGVVFADTNKDGVRGATERGLAGITVYLDLNNDSHLDAGEPQIRDFARTCSLLPRSMKPVPTASPIWPRAPTRYG